LAQKNKKETHVNRQIKSELNTLKIKKLEKKLFDRIIVIIDSSELAEKAAVNGISLGKSLDTNVKVIYLLDTSGVVRAFPHQDRVISPQHLQIIAHLKKQTRSFLDDIKKLCNKLGVKVTTKLVENISLIEIAKKAGRKDLIIIGSDKTSYPNKIFHRNVSEKVLRHASSTVMIIK
jgi:nucleotide-binding universal stress UspA family protein